MEAETLVSALHKAHKANKEKEVKAMYETNEYWKVKDIFSIPCATNLKGEKMISVVDGYCGVKWAYVQYADGMRVYRQRKPWEMWELWRTTICTNI